MSKLLVTNNTEWFNKLNNVCSQYFKLSSCRKFEHLNASIFQKKNIVSENYYSDGENYIFCSGTIFYKEKFGYEALKEILVDAIKNDITTLRKHMLGSYAVLIKINGIARVFVDETHTYCLYYYLNKSEFIITNNYYHIGLCVGGEINTEPFLERGVRRCIMSDSTPIRNVYKFTASTCFEINLPNGDFRIKNVNLNDYSCVFNSRDEALECLVSRIKEVSALRSRHIKKYLHFLTGGIDSRLELAINNFNNDRLSLGYWMGNDVITNGTDSDLRIVSSISNHFGYEHQCYDVALNFENSLYSIDGKKCKEYGEYASLYCGNEKWFHIFECMNDVEYIGFGYLGESLRNLSELDGTYREPYRILDFIEKVYCRTGIEKNVVKVNGFYDFLAAEFLKILGINGNSMTQIDKQTAFRLFTYSRFDADCIMNNFVNLFCYSFPIFGQKKIADAIYSLKYEWLKNDSFSIDLINYFQNELLDFPIYSHHKEFVFDKNLKRIKKSLKFVVLDASKNQLKNTFVYRDVYLRWLHKYIRPQSSNNDKIMISCQKYLESTNITKNSGLTFFKTNDWKNIEIASWAAFVADIKVLDTLNDYEVLYV